jgi:hypothetical protein
MASILDYNGPSAIANILFNSSALYRADQSAPSGFGRGGTEAEQTSRRAAFGIFLTLSFCLVTQPFGSLFYRNVVVFLWRLNPPGLRS